MKVQVLGTGCKKCHLLYQDLQSFIEKNQIEAEIEYDDDPNKFLEARVFMSPAVFIDGAKKSEGKIPTESQFKEWFGIK